MFSLLRVGPKALGLRFYDQMRRKSTGAPVWKLSRITPFLYVGGQHYPKGWQAMQQEGITAVLNLREARHDDRAKGIGGTHHLHLITRDNTPVSLDNLHRAADFIRETAQQGGKVYVHCGVGVGRAPSAAAAYFIKYENMDSATALRTIKQSRPFIHLTGSQKNQLQQFEQQLRGK
jgi:protein-tyrosine phosphatase